MHDFWQRWGPQSPEAILLARVMLRLVVAAILGGIIGLEREIKHKPAGLRTNMFICFGSAMFTILSDQLAIAWPGDHTRIAAQIIPGIGFIGAGSILHARGSVTGLTTAATLFVVASVGMAAGGGLYLTAIFATLVILVALHALGMMEARYSLKAWLVSYDITGDDIEGLLDGISGALKVDNRNMQTVQLDRVDNLFHVQFSVEASRLEHERLLTRLRQLPAARHVESLGGAETE